MEIALKGKVAIVTGAGRGIGREIAETLAREGAVTVVTDVRPDLLDDVSDVFRREGWSGRQYICDVRDRARTRAVVDDIVKTLGRVDVLVNNAGVAPGGPVETLSEEAWDLNLDVNLKGTFLMCQAVIPAMKRQRSGRIINAASFAAILPITGSGAYAASKAALVNLTKSMAQEWMSWNIRVNVLSPGPFLSEMVEGAERNAPGFKDMIANGTLMKRVADPAEIVGPVLYLASDASSFVTGDDISVSGGMQK